MDETYQEQLDRIDAMITDDEGKWDLSVNDIAALAAVAQAAKRYGVMTSAKSYSDCVLDFDGNYVFTFKVPSGFESFDAAVDSLMERTGA